MSMHFTVARYDMPVIHLEGGGVRQVYDFEGGAPDAYVVWRGKIIWGLATTYGAALAMAEDFARQNATYVDDLVLETMPPERRARWP
ncbi:hypothetical protein ACO2RV_21820 [Ancylobacter sp. VNQ12]|uniref:hypothetical protein n=1 Tax=Ancylobacter sp. VNQ12 TaxID=3400920 RepID=UPI003BFC8F68